MENKESNWKGTKGEWKTDYQCVFIGDDHRTSNFEQVISRSYPSDFYNRSNEEAEQNAQLIADAGNVRQQIDCSLPELLERYKRMEEALSNIMDKTNPTFKDGKSVSHTTSGLGEVLYQAHQALNTNTNK